VLYQLVLFCFVLSQLLLFGLCYPSSYSLGCVIPDLTLCFVLYQLVLFCFVLFQLLLFCFTLSQWVCGWVGRWVFACVRVCALVHAFDTGLQSDESRKFIYKKQYLKQLTVYLFVEIQNQYNLPL
jgi:hypothetical protein